MKEKEKVSIIFVCTGNTCRSPMAEFLFKDYLREKKRTGDFTVSSAGLEAAKGDKITPQADEALTILGVKHNPERKARVFTVQMSLDGDVIVGMTDEHAMRCDSDNAVSYVDLIGSRIPDPYGYNTQAYLVCAEQIRRGFDKILELGDQKLKEKLS
ncbi:MAG: hypothetical protein K2O04_07770 [Clostridiales bacterium]|nr:hypothetical protein [Clostridiales bacterium]